MEDKDNPYQSIGNPVTDNPYQSMENSIRDILSGRKIPSAKELEYLRNRDSMRRGAMTGEESVDDIKDPDGMYKHQRTLYHKGQVQLKVIDDDYKMLNSTIKNILKG
jgi:hypothetical protein